ncbi:glycosyltransferase [Arthrobacter sp. zg-Y769]|nr:glycosyltransferase [Arthrobacter sp. zg-Y769]
MNSTVIHPPVDTTRIRSVDNWNERLTSSERAEMDALPGEFILGASRFVPYKRLDLVIAAGELVDLPVVLAGSGPDLERLTQIVSEASVPVTFVSSPSDAMLFSLYQRARAYVFPPVEDFGIMPVEAMAAGAPVLCNVLGGAGESVGLANVGERANFSDPADIKFKLSKILESEKRVTPSLMDAFAPEHFQRKVKAWVDRLD